MFCPSCGAQILKGSAFCSNCGTSLATPVTQGLGATDSSATSASSSPLENPTDASVEAKIIRAESKAAKTRAKSLRHWYRKKRIWILVIILVIITASVAGSSKSKNNDLTSQTIGAAVATQPPVTPTTTPQKAVTLWSMVGSGQESGPKFTVAAGASEWAESYRFNCSNFGGSGNFQTYITGYGNASLTTDEGANQLAPSGKGTDYYYDTGTFSIQVNSECVWTIVVAAVE